MSAWSRSASLLPRLMQALDPPCQCRRSYAGQRLGEPGPDRLGVTFLHCRRRDHDAADRLSAGRFGLKRLFLVSVSGFTVASMLCGMAQSLTQIVRVRVLQGAFGAALVPLSQSVLFTIYPKERQGFAMALLQHGAARPGARRLANKKNYSWRYVFYIDLPIGILACMA